MKKANVKATTKFTKSTKAPTNAGMNPLDMPLQKKPAKTPATKLAKPVQGGWNGLSAALPTKEAVAEAYAPVKDRPRVKTFPGGRIVKQATHKVAAKGKAGMTVKKSAAAPAVEPTAKVEKAVALAAKVAAKKLEPPTASLLHKALKKALFKFVQAEKVEGSTAYGYQHKDQRAAVLIVAADGTEAWQVRFADGATSGGSKLDLLTALLRITTAKHNFSKMRAAEKTARAAAKSPIDTSSLGAGSEGDDYKAPVKLKPMEVAGVPANVARAVEMLGSTTNRRYDVASLGGEKNYGKRLGLLKKLFDRDRVLVEETGITKLIEAFHSAVGTGEGTKTVRAEEFVRRCKDIDKRVRMAKAEVAKREKALAALKARRATRIVPGTVTPYPPELKLSRAQRKIRDVAVRESVKASLLATSPEQPAVPHPHAELTPVCADLRLLEDMSKAPEERIVMLQMERANSQGAITVYNNGTRVAAGVVAPETLKALRVVTDVSPADFAKQLLNPVAPSVPVTSVAMRHLTAVINCCKENDMVTAAVASKKFEATKSTKSTKKPASKAAKEAGAPRKSSLFRLSNATAKEWGAFATQKGEIIAAFKKLNAVGKSVAGITRGELIEALPDVPAANISFYLSKWQAGGIVEKLLAAE